MKPYSILFAFLILAALLAGCRGQAEETGQPTLVATRQAPLRAETATLAALTSPVATVPDTPLAPTPTLLVTPTMPPPAISGEGTLRRNVTYCTVGSTDLKMDIYIPGNLDGPVPGILYVHGGGWSGGDKSEATPYLGLFEKVGLKYVFATANYRLAPQDPFPAQILDVMCAVRYLRAHAAELDLNPEKIGAWGSSAGGHLVALMGTLDDPTVFENHNGIAGSQEWGDKSSTVQAVLDFFGPADMAHFIDVTPQMRSLGRNVFGITEPGDPWLAAISPVTYVNGNEPPFLILHGDQDPQVPLSQSQTLYDKLVQAGTQAELVVVQGAGHGFPPGKPMDPSFEELVAKITEFFRHTLGE